MFRAVVADGRLDVVRGSAERPDAIIETDSNMLAGLVYVPVALEEAVRSREIRIEGDESVVERFLTLFPLPESARLERIS